MPVVKMAKSPFLADLSKDWWLVVALLDVDSDVSLRLLLRKPLVTGDSLNNRLYVLFVIFLNQKNMYSS